MRMRRIVASAESVSEAQFKLSRRARGYVRHRSYSPVVSLRSSSSDSPVTSIEAVPECSSLTGCSRPSNLAARPRAISAAVMSTATDPYANSSLPVARMAC